MSVGRKLVFRICIPAILVKWEISLRTIFTVPWHNLVPYGIMAKWQKRFSLRMGVRLPGWVLQYNLKSHLMLLLLSLSSRESWTRGENIRSLTHLMKRLLQTYWSYHKRSYLPQCVSHIARTYRYNWIEFVAYLGSNVSKAKRTEQVTAVWTYEGNSKQFNYSERNGCDAQNAKCGDIEGIRTPAN